MKTASMIMLPIIEVMRQGEVRVISKRRGRGRQRNYDFARLSSRREKEAAGGGRTRTAGDVGVRSKQPRPFGVLKGS